MERGRIGGRFDVRNIRYSLIFSNDNQSRIPLGELTSEEPCYGTSATAIERVNELQPKYIRITDFDDFGIEADHIFMTAENYSAKHELQKNDILFARTGATVGKTYFYDGSIGKAIFAGYCIRFRFDKTKVIPKFVYWYTKTKYFLDWVNGIQRPSGQPNINKEEYKSFEIILPSKAVQKDLVSIMDTAIESYCEKTCRANNLLSNRSKVLFEILQLKFAKTCTPAAFAVTSAQLFGRIDADFYSPDFLHFREQIEKSRYKAVNIGDLCENITSGFAAGKQDQADDLNDDERVPQLRPFSITPYGQISFATKKYVPISRLQAKDYCKKDEVLFNNTNSAEWVGKSAVFDIDTPCAASNHITRITLKEGINPYYIAAFFNMLRSIGYWKLLSTYFNNQAGVNTETLKAVRILLPEKSIQDEIAEEILRRKNTAEALRLEAEQDWEAAKAEFERKLLGE